MKKNKILFEEYIEQEFIDNPLNNELIKKRNHALYALIIQISSSFAGFSFFLLRRIILYFFINIISLVLSLLGLYGVLGIRKYYIMTHSMTTSAVVGAYFIYCIIEVLFASNRINNLQDRDLDDNHHYETTIMLLMAIPYLIDLMVGLFNLHFSYLLFKFLDDRNNFGDIELIQKINMDLESKNCGICFEREKNCVFYKCGHKIACFQCANYIRRKNRNFKCPFCRAEVLDVIKQYEE